MQHDQITDRSAGTLDRWQLANGRGVKITILSLGALLQTIEVPDRRGERVNVALGFSEAARYLDDPAYFGCVVGRYANRIAGGVFTLDGVRHELERNNGDNHLHGGFEGFNRRVWTFDPERSNATNRVGLRLRSPDGDQGYPGQVNVAVTYELDDANRLTITYGGTTTAPTVINMTQHCYFNLAGEGSGSILDHELTLNASRFTPVDDSLIPTGELAPVAGTPFDFRHGKTIGAEIRASHPQVRIARGYDHNFVIDRPAGTEDELVTAAEVLEPDSGRTLRIRTTEPGVQFYSGNFLDGSLEGTSGRSYRQSDGFALETQHFPNSPNQPDFPSVILRPDEEYHSRTVMEFGW